MGAINDWIKNELTKLIYRGAIEAIEFLQRIILITPVTFLKTDAFWEIYGKMKLLSIAILATVFMMIAWKKVNGRQVNIGRIIKRLFWYPVAVGICPYALIKFIKVFNRLARMLINTDAIIPENTNFGTTVGLLVFMVAFLVLGFNLIFFYAKRLIKIILFSVLFPVIYVIWCTPQAANIINMWLQDIFRLLVSQVAHALVLLILGTIVMGVSELNPLLTVVCQVGALGVMNEIESIVQKYLNGAEKITGGGIGKAQRRYSKARKTLEYAKSTLKKLMA